MTIRITDDGSERYKCAYPGCGYSSSHDGAYGGFVVISYRNYCPEHAQEVDRVLRGVGLR